METREKLLQATICQIRTKGYTATTVDDICRSAEVTKGSFFHHFKSKEEIAIAAAQAFAEKANALFAGAAFQTATDPLERLLGYMDCRIELLQGPIPQFTCLLGTMVQETYDSHPAIRQACNHYLTEHVEMLERFIEEAKKQYAPNATWTAKSVSIFIQAQIQGAFIFTKARQDPSIAANCLLQLRQYLKTLLSPIH